MKKRTTLEHKFEVRKKWYEKNKERISEKNKSFYYADRINKITNEDVYYLVSVYTSDDLALYFRDLTNKKTKNKKLKPIEVDFKKITVNFD